MCTSRILTVFLLLYSFTLNAQTNIDSLYQLVKKSKDEKSKIENYCNLVKLLIPDKINFEKYSKEMFSYCQNIESKKCKGSYYYLEAYKSFNQGNLMKSDSLLRVSINYHKLDNDFEILPIRYELLSLVNENMGQIDSAITIAEKGYQIASTVQKWEALLSKRLGKLYAYYAGDYAKGLQYLDIAEKELNKEGGTELAALLYEKATVVLSNDLSYAEQLFLRADSIAKAQNNISLRTYVLYQLSYLYRNRGDYKNGIDATNEAIKLSEKLNNQEQLCNLYISLGDLYNAIDNKELAKKNISKGIEIAKKINMPAPMAAGYYSLGQLVDGDESISMFEKSRKILDTLMIADMQVQLYPELISAYLKERQLEKARIAIVDLEDAARRASYDQTFSIGSSKGEYNYYKENYRAAVKHLEVAFDAAKVNQNVLGQAKMAELLSRSYEKLSNYKEALYWRNENQIHADSVLSLENQDYVASVRLTTEFEKEKEITALKTEKEQAEIKAQRNQAMAMGGGAGLLALLSLAFLWFLRKKNQQIQIQNKELSDLNNTKDTLFQIIGHDMKKPTIGFRNVSKNINYLLEKQDYKRLKALGEEVDQDAKSLYTLTDNLLNWALMQKNALKLQFEKVDVNTLIDDNIELFKSVSSKKNITLINAVENSSFVNADRNSLDTVIRNLIDNAIKYTDEGGRIEIITKDAGDMLQIQVKDSGRGFDQEIIQAIENDNMVKSTQGTAGEKGSGIGLQLVKRLIQRNRGNINIASDRYQGTIVSISLPKAG